MTPPPPEPPPGRRLPRWSLAAVAVVALVSIAGTVVLATKPSPSSGVPAPVDQPLARDDRGPAPADVAPAFSVPTRDGGTFSLADHLATDGRPVFLNLWASWCFPCREEMPAIDAASRAHPEVAFVGVAVEDDRVAASAFADEIGISYVIGFDDGGTVDTAYHPLGLPATYLIDTRGIIVARVFGGLTADQIETKLAAAFGG